MRPNLVVAFTFALASPVFAQDATTPKPLSAPPGTEAGAKALATDLAPYVSQTAFDRRYITVAPEAAGYRITMNLDGLIDQFKVDGAKFDLDPMSMVVAPRADGNWDVSSNDPLNVAFDFTLQNVRQSFAYKIDVKDFTGVFSPTLGNFLTGSGEYNGGTMASSDAVSDMTASFGRTTYDMNGKEVPGGVLDYTMSQSIADFSETITMKQSEVGESEPIAVPIDPIRIKIDAKTAEVVGRATGFKSRAIMDLWAFAVVNAEKGEIPENDEALKALLTAALPVWSGLDGKYDINDLTVAFPDGQATLDKVALDFEASGISRSGTVGYSFGFQGMKLQSALIPAWAAGLVPQDFELRTKIVDLDLDTPARLAITDLDLSREEPISDEVGAKIAQSFEKDPPRLLIEPSLLKSQDLEMTLEGDFLFSGAQPEMNMNIEVAGLDQTLTKLRAAAKTDPSINEAIGGIAMAQGFGKTLPNGRVQWRIATKADGSVSLNGNQIVPPTTPMPEIVPDIDTAPTDENAVPPAGVLPQ